MVNAKRIFKIIGITVLLLVVIFLAGRFGWKLFGFRACQGAGIEGVSVGGDSVRIVGFYPGSFPEGFCGYYAREQDGRLYVGFRFGAVFGFPGSGDFDVTIPVKGEIEEVVLKTSMREERIWSRETGLVPQSERYGVYVRVEKSDVSSVSMSYTNADGEEICTANEAWEDGAFVFMDNDIMMTAKDVEAPVYFTITAQNGDGAVVAFGEFQFDADREKMFLTFTEDGRIADAGNDME